MERREVRLVKVSSNNLALGRMLPAPQSYWSTEPGESFQLVNISNLLSHLMQREDHLYHIP